MERTPRMEQELADIYSGEPSTRDEVMLDNDELQRHRDAFIAQLLSGLDDEIAGT